MTGPEGVRAQMITEVAAELDKAGIVTISMAVMGDDLVAISIPNLGDYHRALKLFDAGHGRTSWRGIVVRVHVGRRIRATTARTGGDAA